MKQHCLLALLLATISTASSSQVESSERLEILCDPLQTYNVLKASVPKQRSVSPIIQEDGEVEKLSSMYDSLSKASTLVPTSISLLSLEEHEEVEWNGPTQSEIDATFLELTDKDDLLNLVERASHTAIIEKTRMLLEANRAELADMLIEHTWNGNSDDSLDHSKNFSTDSDIQEMSEMELQSTPHAAIIEKTRMLLAESHEEFASDLMDLMWKDIANESPENSDDAMEDSDIPESVETESQDDSDTVDDMLAMHLLCENYKHGKDDDGVFDALEELRLPDSSLQELLSAYEGELNELVSGEEDLHFEELSTILIKTPHDSNNELDSVLEEAFEKQMEKLNNGMEKLDYQRRLLDIISYLHQRSSILEEF